MSSIPATTIKMGVQEKVKAYFELLKFRLASLVAFSGIFGYSLASGTIDWAKLALFTLAAISITGAANTIGNLITAVDGVLAQVQPEAMLVLGDTNSCLSVIPAKRRKVPIFHMEAGNRCFDHVCRKNRRQHSVVGRVRKRGQGCEDKSGAGPGKL